MVLVTYFDQSQFVPMLRTHDRNLLIRYSMQRQQQNLELKENTLREPFVPLEYSDDELTNYAIL
jgi:hypothetical protein